MNLSTRCLATILVVEGETDPIVVVDYDPGWPREFERLRDRAARTLGDVLERIEHVGSTAVPGLAAKPVIDLDVVVRTTSDVPIAITRLALIGYTHEGDKGITGREAFLWPPGEQRHHLYLCVEGSDALRNHLAFRDYLRSHPEAAQRYAEAKRSAAARFPDDREGYAEAKRVAGEEILTAALDG